ncbi:FHA domain-containing protein [Nocardia cyriacigeorgica]|uniref:FHA domain-containing protein n=1 Tax=Nocardia cyriacigeorgica TaxID=135487 RepID=UPI002453DB6C|nr:FHA domain-containing protein [Nocardia cyriacigeorgica]
MTGDFAEEPRLSYTDDRGHRREVTLGAGTLRITVGRSSQADISLGTDGKVSRLHATIEWLSGHWTIVDDGLSRNGTFVNGHRLTGRHRLRPGDSIRIGSTRMTYLDLSRASGAHTLVSATMPTPQSLTQAQMAVLIALCRPYKDNTTFATPASNQQIARELFLAAETVKTHLRALFIKFGIEDLPQNQKRMRLAERAMHSGIVTERDL